MYIIDRFENEYAVLEDETKKMVHVKRTELPSEAKPGDCIQMVDGSYRVDEAQTKKRQVRIQNLMDDLFED